MDQVFFIIPCVDIYEKIDMRTATYEIPPQEVFFQTHTNKQMHQANKPINIYEKIDKRTATYEIPPQEVFFQTHPNKQTNKCIQQTNK